MQISDDSMRDVSVSQVIRLCVKVDHLKTARVLLRAIQSDKTRAELVADHPVLSRSGSRQLRRLAIALRRRGFGRRA